MHKCALVAKQMRVELIHTVGECETYKEERDLLEMRKIGECGMEKFGTPYSKTIAILGDSSHRRRNRKEIR